MKILITNDDGIESPSLPLLVKALSPIGDVLVVVPDRERSGASHSITLSKPLRLKEMRKDVYSLDGTPGDCVGLVILGGFQSWEPDLVISGVNWGPNMSEDVFYSGTVAAARESALFGIPSLAVSLDTHKKDPDYRVAVKFVRTFLDAVPSSTWGSKLVNVNIPDLPRSEIKGFRMTRLGSRRYKDVLIRREDPWGNPYFWLSGKGVTYSRKRGTDYFETRKGYISITPLSLDLTDHSALERGIGEFKF